ELVGDAQVELWVGLVRGVNQVRQRRVRRDRVVVVELGFVASLVTGDVVVEVDPKRFGSRTVRLVERVVFDVLAVVLKRDFVLGSLIPQMAGLLVGKRLAAVG